MTPLYRQKSGYTLIELIMVISIIILLASVVLQSFSGQKSAQFSAQFEQMVTAPAKVRSLALNSSTIQKDGQNIEPHGYGLFIDHTSIRFFADLPGANMNIFDSGDFVFESDTITINKGFEILIKKMNPNAACQGVSLVYLTPNADMTITVEDRARVDNGLAGVGPTTIQQYNPVIITLDETGEAGTFKKAFMINKISGVVEIVETLQ